MTLCALVRRGKERACREQKERKTRVLKAKKGEK